MPVVKTIMLRLPWPPTVNHYYGRSKSGHVYLKDAGRKYRQLASQEFARLGWPRLDGPVRIDLIFTPPDRRKRDIDNPRKAVYDAISDRMKSRALIHRGIIPDDANIKEDSAVITDPDKTNSGVEVHIISIGAGYDYRK